MTASSQNQVMSMQGHHAGTVERTVLIAFLTVIDLFGTQAAAFLPLPSLRRSADCPQRHSR
jgi:MFS transporter, YNFM family, putative membrane transport protein